jgi:hypothetical protein
MGYDGRQARGETVPVAETAALAISLIAPQNNQPR